MRDRPQPEQKHPREWAGDLNPDRMEGQNLGMQSAEAERMERTAYDLKEVHRSLPGIRDDELKQIPVLPPGQRLQQGATYLDLADPGREEFTATGEMSADQGSWVVAKSQTPYALWNRLRGVDDPERL
jgi:hypothetical protein